MRLSEYLSQTSTKPSALAERAGVAPSTVTRILARERSMSLDMAVKLSRATDGQVTIDDMISEFTDDASGPGVTSSPSADAGSVQACSAREPAEQAALSGEAA